MTPAARLATILYAAIGMPIFLNALGSAQETLLSVYDELLLSVLHVHAAERFARAKVLLCSSTWLLYLHAGSVLFSRLLETWSYETAFYFCFITLTTIGFGDYVPSSSVDDPTSSYKPLWLCFARHLYTFIGMGLTAAWFDVAKDYFKGTLLPPGECDNESSSPLADSSSKVAPSSSFVTDESRRADNNYGGPPLRIADHLLRDYSRAATTDTTLRQRLASPVPSGRSSRSVSPTIGTVYAIRRRTSVLEKSENV